MTLRDPVGLHKFEITIEIVKMYKLKLMMNRVLAVIESLHADIVVCFKR